MLDAQGRVRAKGQRDGKARTQHEGAGATKAHGPAPLGRVPETRTRRGHRYYGVEITASTEAGLCSAALRRVGRIDRGRARGERARTKPGWQTAAGQPLLAEVRARRRHVDSGGLVVTMATTQEVV